jgi:hypothetical protein
VGPDRRGQGAHDRDCVLELHPHCRGARRNEP